MNNGTRKLTTIAMLCAVAYAMTYFARVPVVLFLKYDPKDIVIVLGGLMYGPLASFVMAVIVSLLEMFTNSGTGIWGCVMNIISSCSFACVVAAVYQRKRTLNGAVVGLLLGVVTMTGVMLVWNYLISPIYMGVPRSEIVALLVPAFLPFNLLKGGLNAALMLLLYKPLMTALKRADFLPDTHSVENAKPVGVWLVSALVVVTCVLFILSQNHII